MKTGNNSVQVSGSFRDPSGFLFWQDKILYRQINQCYSSQYDHLMKSGLYKELIKENLLIPHQEHNGDYIHSSKELYKVIQPEIVPFISYPYEWSFSMLQDAALLTLEIQKRALAKGMSLKDCSAYNIQFHNGKPIFIDTLSFDFYNEGLPWVAYRQFCQHFLAPLALMSFTDIRLNQFFKLYIDGIPLDLASSLLPYKTHLRFGLLAHIHLHAKSQAHFADKNKKLDSKKKISNHAMHGLIDSLEVSVKNLKWNPHGTEWSGYYDDTNYSEKAFQHKKQLISDYLTEIKPDKVWDLGANTGVFSHLAGDQGIQTVAFDIDPAAVEKFYLYCRKRKIEKVLPLLLDLTNPSPSLGWAHMERMALAERGPVEMVFALALIHHLAIGNNVPLKDIAGFLATLCHNLVIEFIPKHDSQVQRLLVTREDIFTTYSQNDFEQEFCRYFVISKKVDIDDSVRTLYLMKKKEL